MTASPPSVEILPVHGIGEVGAGDDVARLIADAAPPLHDGDIVVVTSKVVSKAEGRVVTGDRQAAIDGETVRVVARRGETRIVQTRHGFVMAAAGIDASNVEKGSLVLLPVDPDASARRIRAALAVATGADVGVVISDTFGRPWREGVTDMAIGVAGFAPLLDFRGGVDDYGNDLTVTVVAIADELAAAADLVKGKLDGVPAAIIRGYRAGPHGDDRGAQALVRVGGADLFRYGARDVVAARTDATAFGPGTPDTAALSRAMDAACTAVWPGPGPTPWRLVLVTRDAERSALADAYTNEPGGPLLAIAQAIVTVTITNTSPRAIAAAGAVTQNLLVALTGESLDSRYVPVLPADLAPDAVTPVLAAVVAIGLPPE